MLSASSAGAAPSSSADAFAKVLDEDEDTGIKRYRYIRTGENHFSMAFTYAWLGATDMGAGRGFLQWMKKQAREARGEAG